MRQGAIERGDAMAETTAGAQFNAWIKRHRMIKYHLAADLGVTPEALSRWLSGKGAPSPTARILIEQFTEKHGEKLPREIWGK